MKKKLSLLLVSFIAFYTLVHASRHIPELIHGRLHWNSEITYTLSIIRIVADLIISWLFTLLPYLLLFRFYPDRNFVKLMLWLAISLTFCFLISFWWTSFMEPVPVRLSNYLPSAVFFYAMNIIFGMAFYFIRYSQYKELQQKELVIQSRQSELSFLRSQINPHFLFNHLNNIYSLVYHQSEQALIAISSLSEILRYMLYDTTEKVPLEKEVVYIEKYIDLQKLRFEGDIIVRFQSDCDPHNILIHPLLFLPFVENAFKHGDIDNGLGIYISLNADHQKISFYCMNYKGIHRKDMEGGIGIDNVKKRLGLLYPGKHYLDIVNNDDQFTIKLDIINAE